MDRYKMAALNAAVALLIVLAAVLVAGPVVDRVGVGPEDRIPMILGAVCGGAASAAWECLGARKRAAEPA